MDALLLALSIDVDHPFIKVQQSVRYANKPKNVPLYTTNVAVRKTIYTCIWHSNSARHDTAQREVKHARIHRCINNMCMMLPLSERNEPFGLLLHVQLPGEYVSTMDGPITLSGFKVNTIHFPFNP